MSPSDPNSPGGASERSQSKSEQRMAAAEVENEKMRGREISREISKEASARDLLAISEINLEASAVKQMKALFYRRYLNAKRNWGTTVCQLFCPIFMVSLLLFFLLYSLRERPAVVMDAQTQFNKQWEWSDRMYQTVVTSHAPLPVNCPAGLSTEDCAEAASAFGYEIVGHMKGGYRQALGRQFKPNSTRCTTGRDLECVYCVTIKIN